MISTGRTFEHLSAAGGEPRPKTEVRADRLSGSAPVSSIRTKSKDPRSSPSRDLFSPVRTGSSPAPPPMTKALIRFVADISVLRKSENFIRPAWRMPHSKWMQSLGRWRLGYRNLVPKVSVLYEVQCGINHRHGFLRLRTERQLEGALFAKQRVFPGTSWFLSD